MESALDLNGKIALVTGGGTGIGLMIAEEFCKNGAKVYITGRRLDVLKKAAVGKGLTPLQMDVSDKQSIENAVKAVDEAEGKLDILVNNAGIFGIGFPFAVDKSAPEHAKLGGSLFAQGSFDQWTEVLKTNTIAPYFVIMGFLSLLERGARSREGETSSVVNITSAMGAMRLSMGYFPYPVSKAGINHLTGILATEFALNKIPVRVNGIAPGAFPSEIIGTPEEVAKWITKPRPGAFNPTPLLRAGKPVEIGTAAVFLSSVAGEFVNGIIMNVDGGYSLVNP
ncbi:hypothetical protein D9758_008193 [Tetrapyrgos nigripes]|uniref:Short-chain dehydrogenase n=1 Tax=Tetrapyrgos nigripes TaxID=182062 RepID=A0A8H5GHR8_9AGAR|nr:hypothetical protein D9758_008193 [Tetrapyrgos nigripes]